MSFGQYLKEVKAQIRETDVEAVRKTVEARKGKAGDGNGAGPVLIDVREKDEWTEGYIPGARWIPRGFLELRIEDRSRSDAEIVLYCAGGTRSALAAQVAGRARLHQREVAGGRVLGLEAGRADLRPAVRDDAGAEPALRAPHDAARGRRDGAGEAAAGEGAAAWARAGSARRPGSTWRRRASARSASSTTTWSTRRTCSGRSSTRPTASACPRSSRRADRDRQAEPRREGDPAPDAPRRRRTCSTSSRTTTSSSTARTTSRRATC